jgi:hypothetical protein
MVWGVERSCERKCLMVFGVYLFLTGNTMLPKQRDQLIIAHLGTIEASTCAV